MKRYIRIIFTLMFIMLLFPLTLVAEVYDTAGILAADEEEDLSRWTAELESLYTIDVNGKPSNVGVYIVTIESKDSVSGSGMTISELAEDLFNYLGVGAGDDKNGILLLLDMEAKEVGLFVNGPAGNYVFSDSEKDFVLDVFVDGCNEDGFYHGFFDFLNEVQWQLRDAWYGEDFDYEDYEDYDYDYDDYDVVDYTSGQSSRTRSTGGTVDVSDYADEVGSEFFDGANLVSREKLNAFNSRMLSLEKQYGVGIYIITLPDKASLGADGYYIEDLAEALYEASDFGLGDEKTGLLLLMDMGERDYDIMAHGTKGHYAFTDYGKELLANAFLDDFAENEWADGFGHYLDEVERQLMWAEKGEPVDIGSESEKLRSKIGIPGIIGVSLLIGLLFALIVCTHFKNQMKSVRPAASAADFTNDKGVEYSQKADDYLRTTTTTRIIESSSSKGGTSVNSRGYSHSSGKF